jgi:N-acetylmuramoyl-L-alanine amidase
VEKLIKKLLLKEIDNMTTLYDILVGLDDGHGMETSGKRTPAIPELDGRVIRENEFNRVIIAKLKTALERCGFKTYLTAPEDTDTSLATRVNRCNSAGCDILISAHYNANTGSFATNSASGFEVLAGSSTASHNLSQAILNELGAGTAQKNRGVKDGSWLYLNNVACPLALVEYGFMDWKPEAILMISSAFTTECAEETAKGICKYFGKPYVAPNAPAPTEPAPELKGIGTCDVLQDCNFHEEATSSSPIIRQLKAGDHYNVYSIKDGWCALGGGYAHQSFLKVEIHSHIVEAGDTLWSISVKYNTTVDAIKKLNGLTSDSISVGQKLRVK